ncbi:preprotein translocase subunit SecE [Mycobacterium frederiksbergense]|uniref:Protein translocase subunit SecE n=1 Tax=Mycolicibacterium frederiksbergense TaxID=117567 RepID=A0ABT6L4T7_9MYCO|nr:preprotein translocase subunit SecE [Mycolicibacterium frederiksbergense]MDH6197961.1 preprotein translocase subunit SecE [Mycolicibacterium frederiksbergense]
MSDEREGAGSADDTGTGAGDTGSDHGQTAVVTRPLRPTGKRSRRGAVSDLDSDETVEVDAESSEDAKADSGKAKKAKKAKKSGPSRNPIMFVVNYLKQVVAELRKVIWPNRKQMVSYTTVVLVFLAFMVALIAGADYGLGRLVSLVFGT